MAAKDFKILVPTDFSETADAALAYAKSLAGRIGASVHLLYVFTDPYGSAAYGPEVYVPLPPEVRERAIADARARLAERLDADQEVYFRGTRTVVAGAAAKEIVQFAADQGIDLIVMGTHGRRGVVHLLLGSVAELVVRTARCPVLTVRGTVAGDSLLEQRVPAEQVA